MIKRSGRCAATLAMVGLLVAGCGSSTSSPGGGSAEAGAAASGSPKDILLAALTKMDGLHTYRAELTMANMGDLGSGAGSLSVTSQMEVSVDDNIVYQSSETSGVPIDVGKQETLIRGSEYLTRSDQYSKLFGASDPSVTPDTWFRVAAPEQAGGQPALMVSMYFAPAARAIDTVSAEGTATVRGTEVDTYRAVLDPEKFASAMSGSGQPGGLDLSKMPTPHTVDYGVGTDGYVHSIAFGKTDDMPDTTIEVYDYNAELNLPNPTHVVDMPK